MAFAVDRIVEELWVFEVRTFCDSACLLEI